MHLVSHKFVLESNDVAETPRSIVAVQLLGPFSVRCTFCILPLALSTFNGIEIGNSGNELLLNLYICLK